jgi:UDPglucose 6-dehydrogenase/GDP-mannose 6-dehydrogenase
MKVSIIGAGYVGLVTGACLAEVGHDVTCAELDAAKVEQINARRSPLHEPGLQELLEKNVPHALRATTSLREAVLESDLTMIAVPTPFDATNGRIDLRFVERASEQVGEALRDKHGYHVVVVKSTVVPGTTETVVRAAVERRSGKTSGRDFGIGVNPEFLSEGTAVRDFMQPDRIVIGGDDPESIGCLAQLYAPFGHVPTICVNCRTAEMIKYASNTLLATCISFANEIATICEAVGGIDVVEVMRGVHASRYLAGGSINGSAKPAAIARFIEAGCGFGGSCLPKDTAALAAHGKAHGAPTPLLDAVLQVNREQARRCVSLITRRIPLLRGKTVVVLGTAFKPGTADLRQSPAEPIIEHLSSLGAIVRTFDPAANDDTRRHFGSRVQVCDAIEEALDGADAVVVCTAWKDFARLPDLLRGRNDPPVVVDGRRMLDPGAFSRYEGIGLRVVDEREGVRS